METIVSLAFLVNIFLIAYNSEMQIHSSDQLVKNFADLIRLRRNQAQFTLEELADRSGIHRTMIGLVEKNERVPTLYTAKQIANALDIPLFSIIQDAESNSRPDEVKSLYNNRSFNGEKNLRNESSLREVTCLDPECLIKSIQYCYSVLDLIDDELLRKGLRPLSEMIELANLSSMIGNILGEGIARHSNDVYKRNKPHTYPDLLHTKGGTNLEIKIALGKNQPKGHLPKSGKYMTFRYVLSDLSHNQKTVFSAGNTVWIWEVKVGELNCDDFRCSNTVGDSGKTANISSAVFNKMPLVYYDPSFLPYKKKSKGLEYPGYN